MNLKILSETTLTREVILTKEYCPKNFKNEIKNTEILILPNKNFRDQNFYYFSDETLYFFHFLKEKNISSEFCIDNENFNTLQLHSDEFRFSHMLLGGVLLPIFVNLLTEYISTKLKNSQNELSPKISIELTIEKKEKNINLKYEGPIDEFSKILKEISKED